MRTIPIPALPKVVLAAFVLVLLSSLAYSRQAAQDEPLGDVARENHAAGQAQKAAPAKKIYHNSSLSSPAETGKNSAQSNTSVPTNASTTPGVAATSSGETQDHPKSTNSVFDRPKKRHDHSDFFIVPAFTEIRVEV
ncbi:MAG: hypothetical protein ACRD4I_11080, partial [Candidatus Angelobacter sp.]